MPLRKVRWDFYICGGSCARRDGEGLGAAAHSAAQAEIRVSRFRVSVLAGWLGGWCVWAGLVVDSQIPGFPIFRFPDFESSFDFEGDFEQIIRFFDTSND